MKKTYMILFTILCAGAMFSCDPDYSKITNPASASSQKPEPVYDWEKAADSCSVAFIERFYCSEPRNGAEGVFSYSEYNVVGGNGSCYWQQAHAMAVLVEYYNRIKASDPAEAATLEGYMQTWFGHKGNNYEGNPTYRGSSGFGNDFTDDTLWNTIALLQMYEATGVEAYYLAAKNTFDECVRPRFAYNQFGWLPWKWTDLGANECTNGPGSIAAAMLAAYAKEAGNIEEYEQYLQDSFTCFDQNMHVMNPDGTLGSVPLSYTQGTCMEAGRLLWHLTGEKSYLLKGIKAAKGQMNSASMNEKYDGYNVMRSEGTDGNNAIFHAVFFHWASRMILDEEIDAVDPKIRGELYKYVKRHALHYWTTGVDKSSWNSSYFSVKCYTPRGGGDDRYGALGAYAGAAQCIEAMCLMDGLKF